MKAAEVRKLTEKQINEKIAELKSELFNLKFQAALGNLEKPTRMGEITRDIARMKTILTEGSYLKEEAKKTRSKKAGESAKTEPTPKKKATKTEETVTEPAPAETPAPKKKMVKAKKEETSSETVEQAPKKKTGTKKKATVEGAE